MHKDYLFFSCTLVGLLVLLNLSLSARSAAMGDTLVNHYTVKDGLPNRSVQSSTFDKDHLLWIGTNGGICRADGNRITSFPEFPQLFNGTLCLGEEGYLYSIVPNYPDSVEIFDPGSLEVFGDRLGNNAEGFFAGVSQQTGGALYFALGSTIFKYNPGGERHPVFSLGQELMQGDELISASPDDYLLYRKAKHQLIAGDKAGTHKIPLPSTLPAVKLYQDLSGGIWFSSTEGLFYCTAEEDAFSLMPGLASGGTVNFFMEDSNDNILIGYLDPGMKRISSLEMITATGRKSAEWLKRIDERIISISGEDFAREIRLNTYGGLFYIRIPEERENPFRRYLYRKLAPGKFGHVMRGFAADDAGNVYANKDSRLPHWFRMDAETGALDSIQMIDPDGTVADHWGCGTNLLNFKGDIFGHSCDLDGETYLGTVYRYRPTDGSWKRWDLPRKQQVVRWVANGRSADELLLITEHKENHREGQLYYFYPALDSFALIKTAGPEYSVLGYTKGAVRDTSRNCLWFGTDQAFYRFDFTTERLRAYYLEGGKNTAVTDVTLGTGGDLLLSTLQRGLQVFYPETGTFTTVGGVLEQGHKPLRPTAFLNLPSNDIAAIRITKDTNLLIFTFNGLVLHGPRQQTTNVFTVKDGLGNDEFNTASIFFNEKDNRWYAGGINGFVSFKVEDLIPEQSRYQPTLTSYRILDEKVGYETVHNLPAGWKGPLVLPSSVVYCTFDFTVPDFFADGDRTYQTFLEGFDPDWTGQTTVPFVRYTQLHPGAYTFHLKAYDGDGRKTAEMREITISVLKPWYQSYWFYAACLGVFGLLIYGIYHHRLNRLKAEMETTRRFQSLELRSLRQQLNPHFISNAMNAIREYIQREEADAAAKYLTDFSLMMRLFLESSRHRFTTVTDETDMLRRYINLEQLRFPGRFTYQITIDQDIDPDMDEVPSLLLQPIVENAINHGLRPLSNGGELNINFRLDSDGDDVLICTISDNGVGRKISALRETPSGHVSRATQILADRQNLLAENDRIELSVNTADLYPERKHTGTEVTLRIEAVT
jgi:hypothetical protein